MAHYQWTGYLLTLVLQTNSRTDWTWTGRSFAWADLARKELKGRLQSQAAAMFGKLQADQFIRIFKRYHCLCQPSCRCSSTAQLATNLLCHWIGSLRSGCWLAWFVIIARLCRPFTNHFMSLVENRIQSDGPGDRVESSYYLWGLLVLGCLSSVRQKLYLIES